MARRIPPLNALRAFEAAARHLSFTQAAEELHVTQAAISHQVKALEEMLGVMLFRRLNRRLLLTEAGQAYLPTLRQAFDAIAAATERLHTQDTIGTLKVSVLPSFGAKWLLPRLARFRERHPEIDVMLSSSGALVDFARDDVDVAIRFGRKTFPDLRVDHLMDDETFPVCSPRLLEGPHALRTAADLKHHVLLHDSVSRQEGTENWRDWLEAAGVDDVTPDRGPGYSDSGMLLQATIAGQGVALGRRSIAGDDMKAGLLVQPFGPRLPHQFTYRVVSAATTAERPKIRLFREWLLAEAARYIEEQASLPGA